MMAEEEAHMMADDMAMADDDMKMMAMGDDMEAPMMGGDPPIDPALMGALNSAEKTAKNMVIGILIFGLVLNTTLYFTLNSYFSTYLAEPEPCGIPIVYWNSMFWMFLTTSGMISSSVGLAVIFIFEKLPITTIVLTILGAIGMFVMAGWTIYGYTLAGDVENDCAINPTSAGWNTAMIVVLTLGSCCVCCAPC